MLADPLRLFDSCLISDGGAAYVTTSAERAPRPAAAARGRRGVGEGYSDAGAHWAQQRAFTSTPQVFTAPGAFAMAGLDPGRRRRAHRVRPVHRRRLMQIEDMGFCPKGEAGAFVEGDTLLHDAGKLPFNTHGGLLSHAYVLGIAHVVECVKQLRGTAPAQVPDCEVAVYGGYTGHMASTLVLTKDRVSDGDQARRLPAARRRRPADRAVLRRRGAGRAR